MRVLVLTQHYAPEVTAGRFRLEAFTDALVARGHTVEVVCPVPNHPKGIVEGDFRGRLSFIERSPRRVVRRLAVYTRPVKTTKVRLATYGSFVLGAAIAGSVVKRPDVVVASSPPLTVGAAGAVVAARHRCPLVFDVRDLWPESAVALGELTDGRMLRAAERLERFIYRRSSLIVTANDAFSAFVRELAPGSTPVETVPNGTTREWLDAGNQTVSRREVGLPEDGFVLAYAGNLGLAQSVGVAIEAVGELGEGFHLEVIGEGPRRAELQEVASRLPTASVGFRDLVEPAEAARILRGADALLVAEVQDKTVSAKLYDYSAVGRPIIALARGELERIVEREGVGVHVPLGEPAFLADALLSLRDDEDLRSSIVGRARDFAEAHLRERQSERFAEMLEAL